MYAGAQQHALGTVRCTHHFIMQVTAPHACCGLLFLLHGCMYLLVITADRFPFTLPQICRHASYDAASRLTSKYHASSEYLIAPPGHSASYTMTCKLNHRPPLQSCHIPPYLGHPGVPEAPPVYNYNQLRWQPTPRPPPPSLPPFSALNTTLVDQQSSTPTDHPRQQPEPQACCKGLRSGGRVRAGIPLLCYWGCLLSTNASCRLHTRGRCSHYAACTLGISTTAHMNTCLGIFNMQLIGWLRVDIQPSRSMPQIWYSVYGSAHAAVQSCSH